MVDTLQTEPRWNPPANSDQSAFGNELFAVRLESERFGILAIDRFGFIKSINAAMADLAGYTHIDLHDKPVRILFPDLADEDESPGYSTLFESCRARHPDQLLELVTADGNVRLLDVQMFESEEDRGGVILLCGDMSRHIDAQEALFRQREQLSVIYNQVADAVIMVDRRGYVESWNPVASEMLGMQHRRGDRLTVDQLLRLRDSNGNWIDPFSQALTRGRTVSLSDLDLMVSGSPDLPVVVSATPVRDRSNAITGCVVVMRAVNESQRISSRLSWQETHDPLTQLANRSQMEKEILRAMESARVEGLVHLFLYIDLFNFSVINDTCGQDAGDELLRQVALLLGNRVDAQDVVSRIGNDEFGVLLWNRDTQLAVGEVEAILSTISDFSVPWGPRHLRVGASIGVYIISEDSASAIDVMLAASAACATAKEAGRNRIHYHSSHCPNRADLSQWTARIGDALHENRFILHCQPIVPLRGGEGTRHFEVLVRMVDPDGNIVAPGKFIPAAEFSGLIDEIDRWVLDQLLRALEAMPDRRRAPYSFSVNLSGNTLGDEKFLDFVLKRFRQSSVSPDHIHFEITETTAVRHFDRAVRFITALSELGCTFALDDFGSGLSSFGYLKQLPVSYLKIDGSFVSRMEVSDVDYSMVSTINHLAHVMGLQTIAECVENRAQLALLEEIGVDFVQGYLLATPMPLDVVLQ